MIIYVHSFVPFFLLSKLPDLFDEVKWIYVAKQFCNFLLQWCILAINSRS